MDFGNIWGGSKSDIMKAPGGANQWMSYPSLPNFGASYPSGSPMPGPAQGFNPMGGFGGTSGSSGSAGGVGNFFTGVPGGKNDMGGNVFTAPTYDPAFTSSFFQMLQGLLGGGSNLQGDLLSFLSGGPTNIPGASSLASMAQTGNPISALPEWQKMLDAQQRNIGQNQANLKEQFAFAGDLASSPFGTAMTDYMTQTTKDQNALLAQLEQQAMEAAMGRELQASTSLTGLAGAESQFLDQLFASGATASPSLFTKSKTGGLSGLLGGVGSLLGGIGSLGSSASEAGGIGALLAGLI